MSAHTPQAMHADHHRWSEDNAAWRDDLRAWEHETHEAELSLGHIRTALKHHLQSLQQHAAAIRLYEQASEQHEHALAQAAQGDVDAAATRHGSNHQAEAKQHGELKLTHEHIKQQHHARIAAVRTLLKALEIPG
ncbi:MAG: hypothetical protein JNM18_13045 [Planctomycetaceae bacterium]|nr:hypothetical protein [Planctomycetaceae bacterium]